MDVKFHLLDDELTKLYHDFKRGQTVEPRLLQRFLRCYRPPHHTNAAQLKRCAVDDTSLLAALMSSQSSNLSLEALSEQTLFKYVLSVKQSTPPFIDINSKQVATELIYSLKKDEIRTQLEDHLKRLLADAKLVVIADKYLNENEKSALRFFEFFTGPTTVFLSYPLSAEIKNKIKKMNKEITLKSDSSTNYKQLHDRYILIDRKVEIILTSGVDYIFDESKECTAIIRAVKA